jgi:hypothetical protein
MKAVLCIEFEAVSIQFQTPVRFSTAQQRLTLNYESKNKPTQLNELNVRMPMMILFHILMNTSHSTTWFRILQFQGPALKQHLNHLLLDTSPNPGPLISRWELDKFKIC